jgi:F-type H+-transporting ATPase subunit gamma
MRTEQKSHPLLEERVEEKILVAVVTADKGLCGAFNANVIKAAQTFMNQNAGLSAALR